MTRALLTGPHELPIYTVLQLVLNIDVDEVMVIRDSASAALGGESKPTDLSVLVGSSFRHSAKEDSPKVGLPSSPSFLADTDQSSPMALSSTKSKAGKSCQERPSWPCHAHRVCDSFVPLQTPA